MIAEGPFKDAIENLPEEILDERYTRRLVKDNIK